MITNTKKKKRRGTPKPPDGGWGWWVVAASFLIHVIADGVAYTFGLFFVYISQEFQESKSATSWITSIMVGMTYGSGPIAGAVVNKFGCRVTSIIGSFVAAFGFAISYYAQSVTFLYLSIGLVGGLGLGFIYLPAIISVTVYFDKRRAFATGIAVCGSGFGTAILAPIVEILIRRFTWRLALVIMGGILLSCFIISCFFKPLKDIEEDDDQDEEDTQNFPSHSNRFDPVDKRTGSPSCSQNGVELLEMQCFYGRYLENTDSLQTLDPYRKRHSLPNITKIDSEQNKNAVELLSQSQDNFSHIASVPESSPTSKPGENGSDRNLDHINKTLEGDGKRHCCTWLRFSAEIKALFNSMLNSFAIFKDPIFLFFGFSNFLVGIGYNVPYIYLVDLAVGNDSKKPVHSIVDASFLLTIVGFANTVSRVVLGYLSDKSWMNRLYLYNLALIVCGLATATAPFVHMDLNALRVCSGVFGAAVAVYASLTSVIFADLLGLEKSTNAFGILLLFEGVATVIGPPIVGLLCDHFNNYKYGFGLAGGMIVISGVMLFFIPLLQKKQVNGDEPDLQVMKQQALPT